MTAAAARAVAGTGVLRRPNDIRVLDVGSGTGVWIDFWHRLGIGKVVGLDLVESAVERLRKRFPADEFHVADISAAVPLESRFDVISVMNVLLHITDPVRFERALANLRDLLAPGGVLVVMDPVVVRQWHGPPADAQANSKARPLADWELALGRAGLAVEAVAPVTFLLAEAVDTRTRTAFTVLRAYWQGLTRSLYGRERTAAIVGRLVYVADRLLVARASWGPSTKCMLIRAARGTAAGGA